MDQRELVERAQRGDHDAFAVLAGMFVARLDAAARLILRDHELARDAVQEGFIEPGGTSRRFAIRIASKPGSEVSSPVPASTSCAVAAGGPMEVELLRSTDRRSADIASVVADRDLLELALRAPRTRAARRHRPALLPRDAAARRGGGTRDPSRDRQVPAPSIARADARGDRRRP